MRSPILVCVVVLVSILAACGSGDAPASGTDLGAGGQDTLVTSQRDVTGGADLAQVQRDLAEGEDVAAGSDRGGHPPPPPPGTDGSNGIDGAAPGDMSADLDLGPPLPTPIRHVIVIVKENHSFDNYFMNFPGARTSTTGKLSNNTTITRPQAPTGDLPSDISHSHPSALKDYAKGAMNGWDTIVPGQPHLPYVFYAESQIPNYWALAREFVLGDNNFSTLAGPSSPGHFAIATAQTPHYDNGDCTGPDCDDSSGGGCLAPPGSVVHTFNADTCSTSTHAPCFDIPAVTTNLPAGLTWKAYASGAVSPTTTLNTPFMLVKSVGGDAAQRDAHLRNFTQLQVDLDHQDTLPNYMHIDIGGGPNHISEHPPAYPCNGENYTVGIINKIMQGPHWQESLIIVTWDDFGGFYDHVKPTIETCPAGAEGGLFFHSGFRLPILIISPFSKKGADGHGLVYTTKTEQASIPRLVEDIFGMPRLSDTHPNARDGRAGSLLEALDFTQSPRSPLVLQQRTCPPSPP